MDDSILFVDTVPQTPEISGRSALIMLVALIGFGMYILPKSNTIAKGSVTTGVTTQVMNHGYVGR